MATPQYLSDDEIDHIIENIGSKWRMLGKRLGLNSTQLADIQQMPSTLNEKVDQMLEMWKVNSGEEATKDNMLKALTKLPHMQLVHALEKWPTTSPKSNNTQSVKSTDSLQPKPQVPCASKYLESDFYPFKRGYCTIINNENFVTFPPRRGSSVDVAALKATFENFNFDVDDRNSNLCADDMQKVFEKFRDKKYECYDCFVCCISSHGDAGVVYGSDEESLNIENDIVRSFTADKCSTFNGKPKLFFIQACQGQSGLPGVHTIERDATPLHSPNKKITPILSDHLLYVSTVTGFYSFRNTQAGSYFFQHLTKTLNENGHEVDIVNLLTSINNTVSGLEFSDSDGEKCTQMPIYSSTLRKLLKFKRRQP